MRVVALVAGLSMAAVLAESPPAILEVLRLAGEALANRDEAAFLEQFDKEMPDLQKLKDQVAELLAANEVASTIDVVTDQGDDQHRDMQLDWVLRIGDGEARRRVVKITLAKRGKRWKITALEPLDFFRK